MKLKRSKAKLNQFSRLKLMTILFKINRNWHNLQHCITKLQDMEEALDFCNIFNVAAAMGHQAVLCVTTCWVGQRLCPTILVTFASVFFNTGQYWHSWAWIQLADWAQSHLHQCKPVHLPVLFLLFTGYVCPASCRLLPYWVWCRLVFGWHATWSLSSAKWQLPLIRIHCLHLRLGLTYFKYSATN